VSVDAATQVDPTDLDENTGLDDDYASVHRVSRFTASGCEAEGDTCGESSREGVLEQSHLSSRVRDPVRKTFISDATALERRLVDSTIG
jgi:hypothetical protein